MYEQLLPLPAIYPQHSPADHIIIAIIRAVGWAAVIVSVIVAIVISAGDVHHLSGVDAGSDSRVGGIHLRQSDATAPGDLGQPIAWPYHVSAATISAGRGIACECQ